MELRSLVVIFGTKPPEGPTHVEPGGHRRRSLQETVGNANQRWSFKKNLPQKGFFLIFF